jgi:hypothetical protein
LAEELHADEIMKVVKDVLNRTSEFSVAGEPVPGKHGLRVTLLKTATLNPSLDTSASVDRLRLILESELLKSGYCIAGWTQSKFELRVDVDRDRKLPAMPAK